jgi:hypothetical protein
VESLSALNNCNYLVHWEPNPGPQTDVLERLEDEILYGGARGGGKTDAGMVWMVEPNYISNPRYAGLVIRKNADDLSDWIERATLMYRSVSGKVTGKPPVIRFPSGAYIRLGHLKDENAYEKYQGHEYHKILLEELTQIPNEERYTKLVSSCRTTVPGLKAQVFCTANPGGPGHAWVKSRFVDAAKNKTFYYEGVVNGKKIQKTRIFIPSRVEDTPQLIENDPGYVLFLDNLPEDLRRAWREGDWTVFAGQFFSEWREAVHVIEPFQVPNSWDKVVAVDWGYDPHPYHVGWYAISPDKRVVKYREAQNTETSPEDLGKLIVKNSKHDENIMFVVGDTQMWEDNPFARQQPDKYANRQQSIAYQINVELREIGLHMRQANKARQTGWVNIKTLLKWKGNHTVEGIEFTQPPRFQVFSTCTKTMEAYPMMIHDEKRPGDMEKMDGDDPCDTDRYAINGMIMNRMMPAMHTYHEIHVPKEPTIWERAMNQVPDLIFAEEEPERESLY